MNMEETSGIGRATIIAAPDGVEAKARFDGKERAARKYMAGA
jgi:hypothetical protein